MDILELLEQLHQDEAYKKWKTTHEHSFLAHIFKMLDDLNQDDFQVGYYNEDDTITTFLIAPEGIKKAYSDGIFKAPGAKILKLDEKEIKLSMAEALAKAEKFQTTGHEAFTAIKIITILQNTEEFGQIYNVTYISSSLDTLNMKIDAATGEIVKNHSSNLIGREGKGEENQE